MFLHLGADIVIPTKEIVAIVDADLTRRSQATSEYLTCVREEGFVRDVSEGTPKSLVVATSAVYLSPISVFTLRKRAAGSFEEETGETTD